MLGIGIFSVAAGVGHVYEISVRGNSAPNNAGPVMYIDLFYPVFLVLLLWLLERKRSKEAGEPEKSS